MGNCQKCMPQNAPLVCEIGWKREKNCRKMGQFGTNSPFLPIPFFSFSHSLATFPSRSFDECCRPNWPTGKTENLCRADTRRFSGQRRWFAQGKACSGLRGHRRGCRRSLYTAPVARSVATGPWAWHLNRVIVHLLLQVHVPSAVEHRLVVGVALDGLREVLQRLAQVAFLDLGLGQRAGHAS